MFLSKAAYVVNSRNWNVAIKNHKRRRGELVLVLRNLCSIYISATKHFLGHNIYPLMLTVAIQTTSDVGHAYTLNQHTQWHSHTALWFPGECPYPQVLDSALHSLWWQRSRWPFADPAISQLHECPVERTAKIRGLVCQGLILSVHSSWHRTENTHQDADKAYIF